MQYHLQIEQRKITSFEVNDKYLWAIKRRRLVGSAKNYWIIACLCMSIYRPHAMQGESVRRTVVRYTV